MEIKINGRSVTVPSGVSVAAAIFIGSETLGGEARFRTSRSGEPRAALCGMGICFECRVTIDGEPHVRSCQAAVRDCMTIET
jgi:D-hydroxyproline dehydrogenase subunit gamma